VALDKLTEVEEVPAVPTSEAMPHLLFGVDTERLLVTATVNEAPSPVTPNLDTMRFEVVFDGDFFFEFPGGCADS